jgi:hypothetical protein
MYNKIEVDADANTDLTIHWKTLRDVSPVFILLMDLFLNKETNKHRPVETQPGGGVRGLCPPFSQLKKLVTVHNTVNIFYF